MENKKLLEQRILASLIVVFPSQIHNTFLTNMQIISFVLWICLLLVNFSLIVS